MCGFVQAEILVITISHCLTACLDCTVSLCAALGNTTKYTVICNFSGTNTDIDFILMAEIYLNIFYKFTF